MNADDWLKVLRANGYRVTEVQETLVHLFMHTDRPFSAEEAWEVARQSRPETGRATVFRTVEKLESLGLLRRVHGYHGCSRYLPSISEAFLLLDEPLNAVGAETHATVSNVLRLLRSQGKTVITAIHDMGRLETDFDGALYLAEGREAEPPTGAFVGLKVGKLA